MNARRARALRRLAQNFSTFARSNPDVKLAVNETGHQGELMSPKEYETNVRLAGRELYVRDRELRVRKVKRVAFDEERERRRKGRQRTRSGRAQAERFRAQAANALVTNIISLEEARAHRAEEILHAETADGGQAAPPEAAE
jgi:hypothetical protein